MENCGRFVLYNIYFFRKNQKQNNHEQHCVTCYVISMVYTLIDHSSQPISTQGFALLSGSTTRDYNVPLFSLDNTE